MHKGVFVLDEAIRAKVYPPHLYESFASLVDLYAPPQTPASVRANPAILRDTEFLFTSWSCPQLDIDFLQHAPKLKVVFYGAGTIKRVVTDAFWQRGLRITHAADANAISVAQWTVGQILLSLKGMWYYQRTVERTRSFRGHQPVYPGLYRSTVGIIGLGLIGRHVCGLLRPFDPELIVCDPLASPVAAAASGARLVDIETLFAESQVVSLHAPWLPETEGMINRRLLELMPPYSTFINTARGALVREDDLIAVLRARTDLFALLDVTYPEPPAAESPLYDLPNVVLTPHRAGATGIYDTARLGMAMLEELRSYLETGALRWEVQRERLSIMA